MGESSAKTFNLKLLVARDKNKVVMAESDKELIEVLFSFMAMPIASVVRKTRNCLAGGYIGCFDNIYSSIEDLDVNFLQEDEGAFRDVLLNPRSAAEMYCKKLELNLIDNGCNDLYVCRNKDCKVLSFYHIGECHCGEGLKNRVALTPGSKFFREEEGYMLKPTARFIITDDFKVMPVALMADLNLLKQLGKYEKLQEELVKIGRDEVLNLLKCSLRSKTPLSDTFLKPSIGSEVVDTKHGMNPPLNIKGFGKTRMDIRLKLIFDKVDNTALYAVVNEDFLDLLCSILTLPLGYIFSQFPCLSFRGCIGNLHKSIQETDINLFFHKERKEIFVNPKLAPGLAYSSNLIDIEESLIRVNNKASFPVYSKADPKCFKGFVRGPSAFLVTDSLEVKPLSPLSVRPFLEKLMVPLRHIGEQEVILNEDKAMRLLAASLTSEHALTSTFLHKETYVNCLDFIRLMWEGKGKGLEG